MDNLPYIIAVDFDGTLVQDKFPDIGEFDHNLKHRLLESRKKKGSRLILWTCRTGDHLKKAVEFCAENGLIFDAINENIPEVQKLFCGDTRKIYADIYLDDKGYRVKWNGTRIKTNK